MSDELKTLQDTATQARAKADELKTALTDASSDEDRKAADDAEQAATDAEKALADAKAKADEEAGDQGEGGTAAGTGAAPNANESRTGFVTGVRPGEQCICPDGRKGTVHKFDEGLVCIPNHDQSE